MTDTKKSIILGVDPGINITGFAIIIKENKIKNRVLVIDELILKYLDLHQRLKKIIDTTTKLITTYKPNELSIESPFYGKNPQSMLKIARAQSMVIAACIGKGVPFVEYSPRKIKKSITGNGNASKIQVAKSLNSFVSEDINQDKLDSSDALATAVCHSIQSNGLNVNSNNYYSWADFCKKNDYINK